MKSFLTLILVASATAMDFIEEIVEGAYMYNSPFWFEFIQSDEEIYAQLIIIIFIIFTFTLGVLGLYICDCKIDEY